MSETNNNGIKVIKASGGDKKRGSDGIGAPKPRMSRTQVISLGFFIIITVGTLLLMLPVSSQSGKPTPFLDALFTATSASCVTGLVTVDTATHWSIFGKCVILVMIQLGGLGFMTIATFFFLLINRRMGLRGRELLSESISTLELGGIMGLAKKIIAVTAVVELSGAALLSLRFCPQFGTLKGIFMGIFHSVSAFCNAGFDLLGGFEKFGSFVPYYSDVLVNLTLIFLIVTGGLGFLVWDDMLSRGLRLKKYRLHSKIVLTATGVLLFFGAVILFFTEGNAACANMPPCERILTALFGSVTARTAGFNTIDIAAMSDGGKLSTIILMFIGGSPGSTAGGIKTTTVFTLLIYMFSYIRHSRTFGVFGRRLEDGALDKAATVFFSNLMLMLTATLLIVSIDKLPLVDTLFETTSAVATVGMSTGITRSLSEASRVIIIMLMFLGRVGSLSFGLALAERRESVRLVDPVEKILIG
ncbi:MAG: Trk family potassium uptake protein [Clostridia bacterium]|nr:Trk family potassium uptake protein [Clostridia bacterium]